MDLNLPGMEKQLPVISSGFSLSETQSDGASCHRCTFYSTRHHVASCHLAAQHPPRLLLSWSVKARVATRPRQDPGSGPVTLRPPHPLPARSAPTSPAPWRLWLAGHGPAPVVPLRVFAAWTSPAPQCLRRARSPGNHLGLGGLSSSTRHALLAPFPSLLSQCKSETE